MRRYKWLFTLGAVVFFLLFGSLIPDDDLSSRAMAVGLGVDLNENGEIEACAQIIAPASTKGESAGTRVVCADGNVLNTALSRITEKCGLTLTASHCNVVLIGKRLIESGESLKLIFTLLENTYVNDNAYVFACEGSPKDIFTSKSGFGQNASQYLQQLITMYGTYENITYRTLRQVIVGYHNLGEVTYMPYVISEPIEGKVPDSSSYEQPTDAPDMTYNLNHVQILKQGKDAGVYGEDALRAINYLLTEVDKGSDDFEIENGRIGVFILNNKADKAFDLENKLFSVDLTIGITIKDVRPSDNSEPDNTFSHVLEGKNKENCEKQLQERIVIFYNEMKEKDIDVFAVKQRFYSKYGKKAESLSFQDVDFSLNVHFTIEK